jgi:hypothetical protein
MRRWSLWACLAPVLSAHGVLAWALVHGAASGSAAPRSRPAPAIRLVSLAVPAEPSAPLRPSLALDREISDAVQGQAPAPGPAAPSPSRAGARPVTAFLSPAELDLAARPRSAPDTTRLEGLQWSGVPMRLRLFVDAGGTVVDVLVLQSRDTADVVQRVREMFLATGFIAARANGLDVPSYKDVDVAVGDRTAPRGLQREDDPGQSAAGALQ